ncbi:MAG: DUF2232 domain-containing protein [Thermodesulfobacteriota bacterium]
MAKLQDGLISRLDINPTGIAITFAVWILPIINVEFVWLQFFAPLPVFYFLVESGASRGVNTLTGALLITGLTATAVGAATAFFFLVTMLPVGYVLAKSMATKAAPIQAGFKAFVALLLGWGTWSLLYSMANHSSLYQDILTSLDQGLMIAGETILNSTELPNENALAFEAAFSKLRDLIPHIMPGLLLVTMTMMVFLTMVIGQWLLNKKNRALSSWPPFAEWRLPEQLVAVIIVAGIFTLLPGAILNDVGLNVIFLAGTLYFFQGLSVINALLARWKAPFWVLIVGLVFFQVYGFIFLAVLGLADVWVDFRKRGTDTNNINL